MVRLLHPKLITATQPTACFNPTMVRLLPVSLIIREVAEDCFNPTMVRLLPKSFFDPERSIMRFQSHNGAIAAIYDRRRVKTRSREFQSHNGAIAAVTFQDTVPWKDMFQSHNGAIAANQLPATDVTS